MLKRHRQIVKFIDLVRESSDSQVEIFTQGACYRFHEILKMVFLDSLPYYDGEHVISRVGSRYYDITGEIKDVKGFKLLTYKPTWGNKYGQ